MTDTLIAGVTTHSLVQYSYDAKGRLDCTATWMNPAAFGSLPGSACWLGAQGSFGPDRITQTIYTAADEVRSVRVAHGTADQADEVTSYYTANGRPASLIDAEDNLSLLGHDGHDRHLWTQYPVATKGAGAGNPNDWDGVE